MKYACGIEWPEPKGTIRAALARQLLETSYSTWQTLKTRETRKKHRVGTTGHTHRISYVPAPLFHFYAMTLPWRGKLIAVPTRAIQEAEERNELADQLFILWATERNARVLHKLLRLAKIDKKQRLVLKHRIARLRLQRLEMIRVCIDQVPVPKPRDGGQARASVGKV